MKWKRLLHVLWAAATVIGSAPALAGTEIFESCDGYGAPNREGDGMTHAATRWLGILVPEAGAGDTRRRDTALGTAGIESCTAALADARLLPAHVLRRASLTRARGVHKLDIGDVGGALADFDLADQVAAQVPPPYYQRSFALGTKLLRAYATGRTPAAAAAAGQIRAVVAARPYDAELAFAAARVELAATYDWDAYAANLRVVGRYDPNRLTVLYLLYFLRGHFQDLIDLHPFLHFDVPVGRGGYVVDGAERRRMENERLRDELDGAYAYSLAATGQGDRARQALIDGRNARLPDAAALHGKTPDQPMASPPESAAEARWRGLVELRLQVAAGHADQALAALLQTRPDPDPALLDLLTAIHHALPAETRVTDAVLHALQSIIDRGLSGLAEIKLADLMQSLPEAEVATRLPDYGHGSDGSFFASSGYMARSGPVPNSQTVKFSSQSGTMAMVNELALLRAAQMARERNMHGLIILGHRALARTERTTMYGSVIREAPSGFEAEIDVLFVNPGALPAGYQDAGWRVVDADAIWAALSPVYIVPRPQ